MSVETLKASIRTIPDYPIPGILFWDVTTLFKNAEALKELSDTLYEYYKDKGITKIVGLESRGFILGSILAERLGAGLVLCRKKGKLPAETYSYTYTKEYGEDTIEIHKDAIEPDDVVLVHDDLLATGGSANAVLKLLENHKPKQILANFIIEIDDLGGSKTFPEDVETYSLIHV